MDSWNILLAVLVLLALQPAFARWVVSRQRRQTIERIERARRSRLMLLIHRQETVSILDIPVMRFIDMNDAEAIVRAIELTPPETPIDFVLHTPGGLMLASVQIARALKRHLGKVTVFVPHYALSGGTLIALAADEIVLTPNALLGAVDPQVNGAPASSLLKVLADKPVADIEDDTLILADIARKAVAEVAAEVRALLLETMAPEKAEQIAHTLSEGRWTHDYGMSADEAKLLGLPVSAEMPRDILVLMDLYAQPPRRPGAVST